MPDAQESDSLGDLTPGGSPVKSRIPAPEQAQEIANRLVRDDAIRAERRVLVQGAFNGNAPKRRADMETAGRKGDANLNWKQHRGHIINAWTPFFDLVCEVPVCVDGQLEIGEPDLSGELVRGFCEAFHKLQFGWRGFDDMNQLRDLQMLLHGPGVLAWEDEWNPFPKAILASNFYVPDECDISFENCELAMITSVMTVGQLWKKIQDPKAARAMGWDIEAVREAIMDAGRNNSEVLTWKWDRWEQAFKNGDIYISSKLTKRVQVCTLFVLEMSQKISQKIVPFRPGGGPTKFLFEKDSKYNSWDECICLFPYDIGADGTYHSMKGLGTDIYPYCALLSKVYNSMADLVVTGIKPMWQPTTAGKMEEFQMVKWGGGNMIPSGINPIQMNISQGLGPAIEMGREFSNTLSQNTGAYNNSDVAPPTVEETAKSAMIRATERSKLTKGSHNRFYRGLDRYYAESWRRAVNPDLKEYHPGSKEALVFQAECYAICDRLNVPHGALQKVKNIKAVRSIGLGSAAMRIEIANAIMEKYPYLDPVGQNHALRAWLSAMMSYANVDAFVPSITTGQMPTEDDSIAALENNALDTGGEIVITPRQNHVIHLNSHISSMEQDVQSLDQGANMRSVYGRLEAKAVHSHKHLSYLENNPIRKQEVAAFGERLRALGSIQDRLQQNIEEQDAASGQEQPNGQPSPQMTKVVMDAKRKDAKQEADLQLKLRKQNADIALRARGQKADTLLRSAQTVSDIRLKDLTAAAEVKRKTPMTNGSHK